MLQRPPLQRRAGAALPPYFHTNICSGTQVAPKHSQNPTWHSKMNSSWACTLFRWRLAYSTSNSNSPAGNGKARNIGLLLINRLIRAYRPAPAAVGTGAHLRVLCTATVLRSALNLPAPCTGSTPPNVSVVAVCVQCGCF